MHTLSTISNKCIENAREWFDPKGKGIETKEQAIQTLKDMDGTWKKIGFGGLAVFAFLTTNYFLSNDALYAFLLTTSGVLTLMGVFMNLDRRDDMKRALAAKNIKDLSENGRLVETPEMRYGFKDLWEDCKIFVYYRKVIPVALWGSWGSKPKVDVIEFQPLPEDQ